MMERSLATFPLAPGLLSRLSQAGFFTVEDLDGIKAQDLTLASHIPSGQADYILQTVKKSSVSLHKGADIPTDSCTCTATSQATDTQCQLSGSLTALDLLHEEQSTQHIVTFCAAIDDMLGGGVPLGKITEFCGEPGSGKTQICLQLVVDAVIPEQFGGVGGEAIYIDTEGSFLVDRIIDIASAARCHLENVAKASQSDQTESLSAMNPEHMLASIHYMRCLNYSDVLSQLALLEDFLLEQPKVKLLVIDSIAFPFRQESMDPSTKTRILSGLAQSLLQMAYAKQFAIVLTNHVTTRFKQNGDNKSYVQPTLGEILGHSCYSRVLLEHTRAWSSRYATLLKSPQKQFSRAPFQLTRDGVRDVMRLQQHKGNLCS